ncbi:MBL fold metallo-hydrolase [Candidatus Methylocalor cossyra]|uniref:Glyoxylase-like metal-dependent hydrolase (Beta-lactamase superfamily II) n=1 Tax=Candidatus Methylocalor cossyra TaxID=3108543 RepID=A0ABP1C8I4_9GAMM
MIFRQLFEPDTSTYTYLLGCERTRRAVLIDPVASEVETYLALLQQLGLTLRYTLETHVHADHITGSGLLRERVGSKSVVHRDAGAVCADLLVTDGVLLQVGDLEWEVRHTPGHTDGCVSYVMADRVFTGDALLIGGCGRTDFQQGDAGRLYDSIHQKLFTLPPDTLVYPGHDYAGNTVSTIKQEMAKNARLGGGRSREEFIALMQGLNLPYPKYIDRALPANRACGQEVALPQG